MTQLHPIFQKELDALDEKFSNVLNWIKLNNTNEIISGIDINHLPDVLKSFLLASLQRAVEKAGKEIVGEELPLTPKPYDGNNIESACDVYNIATDDWKEIIRFEDGSNALRSLALSKLDTIINFKE